MVVVMVALICPATERPARKHEANARHEIAQRRQGDGDAVCNRRREVDQPLHRSALFDAYWIAPCSVVTTQAVPF